MPVVASETHPEALVTVKLCVPAARPDIFCVGLLPVIPPGLIVQFPAGNPVNSKLPVATAQVGCVKDPTVGVAGVPGLATSTTLADEDEVHPAALVTVYIYVPATKPGKVLPVPVPAIFPGLIIQFPAGRSVKITLPVASAQLG